MIRTIRFLGAALGGLIGISLVIAQLAVFQPVPGSALLVLAWVIAWIVLGFTLLPYLTVIPALAALRAVQQLSTAEFVTAILGLAQGQHAAASCWPEGESPGRDRKPPPA